MHIVNGIVKAIDIAVTDRLRVSQRHLRLAHEYQILRLMVADRCFIHKIMLVLTAHMGLIFFAVLFVVISLVLMNLKRKVLRMEVINIVPLVGKKEVIIVGKKVIISGEGSPIHCWEGHSREVALSSVGNSM